MGRLASFIVRETEADLDTLSSVSVESKNPWEGVRLSYVEGTFVLKP